jgi:alanine dehydrogenase
MSALLRVLDNDDVARVLDLDDALASLEYMYRAVAAGAAVEGTRSQTHVATGEQGIDYCLKTMDGAVGDSGYMTLRLTSDIVDSRAVNGLPRREKLPRGPGGTWCGLILLFSTRELAPLAIIHDGYLQLVRVACTGALSARHLARGDAGDLGLLGSGGQAWWHLAAMARVRRLRRVRVFSPDPQRRAAFAARAGRELGIAVEAVADARGAVEGADLVVAATNTSVPILRGEWLAPGAHVISIVSGDKSAPRREIDDDTVRRSARVVAHWKQNAMHHGTGDLAGPVAAGVLRWEDVADLSDVIAGKAAGRGGPEDITLFKNNGGMGLQFAALAPVVYERACAAGAGKPLPAAWFLERMVP